MKILIVTHSYAPDPSPRAYRWTAIAETWAGQGFRVDVVTTGRRGGEPRDQQSGVHVHRVGERQIGRFTKQSSKEKTAGALDNSSAASLRRALRLLAKTLHDYTWKKIYWPDYACLWYRPALKEAQRLCRSREYDSVITVSHPFAGHLVGLSLKKVFPDIRWVADIGDPFSAESTVPSNNRSFYRRLNRRAEAAVLARCDAISVTVEGCKKLFVDEFSISPEKIVVIPPLLSLATETAMGSAPFEKKGFVDLVYIGVLYAKIRRPDAVLALFAALRKRLKNIRLHFVGDIQGCDLVFARYPDLMGKFVIRHGPVVRSHVGAILSASDALINIGNDTSHQLPSKLVEYVAAGRPILNVVAQETDTSAKFLKNYVRALTIICPDDAPTDAQIEQVAMFLTDTPEVSKPCLDNIIENYRLGPVSTAYENLVTGF
ncbi:MAG: glycosyltransferase [Proteobacteria bacterium]|nr:glycosyltransferase [Pseudomonadota bacterium]